MPNTHRCPTAESSIRVEAPIEETSPNNGCISVAGINLLAQDATRTESRPPSAFCVCFAIQQFAETVSETQPSPRYASQDPDDERKDTVPTAAPKQAQSLLSAE